MEEEIEEWRVVEGFERYKISSWGRVMGSRYKKEKEVVPRVSNSGYYLVGLHERGKPLITKQVHQLVAIAFLGHKPNGRYIIVNHKNHNKLDNRKSNLEVITQRENVQKYHQSKGRLAGTHQRDNGSWRAVVIYNGVKKNLGCFETKDIAYQVYNYAVKNPEKAGEPGVHSIGGRFQVIIQHIGRIKNLGFFDTEEEANVIFLLKKDSAKDRLCGTKRKGDRWISQAHINGKSKYIGIFDTETEAHQAYLKAKIASSQA